MKENTNESDIGQAQADYFRDLLKKAKEKSHKLSQESRVQRYAADVADLRSVIDNINEMVRGLPAPDENGEVRGIGSDSMLSIADAKKSLAEAFEHLAEALD